MIEVERKIHVLKCWTRYYQDIKSGIKTFEVRINDRGFRSGDELHLREWLPASMTFTGDSLKVDVVKVYADEIPGLDTSYCVMSIRLADNPF